VFGHRELAQHLRAFLPDLNKAGISTQKYGNVRALQLEQLYAGLPNKKVI